MSLLNPNANAKPEKSFLAFTLESEFFAVPLLSVREVIAFPNITPVPYAPPYFLGIMNLRGQILSILDLRSKFRKKASVTPETSVVICELKHNRIGLVVDEVRCVLTLTEDQVGQNPDLKTWAIDYITGVTWHEKKLVLLIDPQKVLAVDEKNLIQMMDQARKAS